MMLSQDRVPAQPGPASAVQQPLIGARRQILVPDGT